MNAQQGDITPSLRNLNGATTFEQLGLSSESDSIVMPVKSGVLMHWHAEVKDSDLRKTRD